MMMPAWVKGTLVLAVTLAAGMVTGVAYERSRITTRQAAQLDAHDLIHRFHEDLGLDSAQRATITAILARRQGTVDSTWYAMRPHVRATLDSTLEEIVAVLRPDQAAMLRTMVHPPDHGVRR